MFEPKIYKRNGLEAFRLVSSDGGEFFYEGAIDCDEKELFKDSVGRMYYRVTTRVGGPVEYYVELDPQVSRIPATGESKKDKDTSRLVNASPRADMSLPDDIYVVPEASQAETPPVTAPEAMPETEVPVETTQAAIPEAELPEETPAAASGIIDDKSVETAAAPPATTPSPPPEESQAMKPEASEAIHAVFSPKAKAPHPPAEQPGKPAGEERAVPLWKADKKRSLKWPAAIAVAILLIVIVLAGVYVVRPGTFDGLRSLYAQPAATPQPTPTPTPEPTATPTPMPTAVPDSAKAWIEFSALVDADSPAVQAFAANHTSASGDGLTQACDLFSYVNARWNGSESYTAPRKASEITGTLEGTQKDYTALMSALLQSIHVESRVIFSYSDDLLRYYPEVYASNTSAGYAAAVQTLQKRYGGGLPQGHSDDTGYWIALVPGERPGIRPTNATLEYALYNGTFSPISIA